MLPLLPQTVALFDSIPIAPCCPQRTPLEEALSRADQTSFAGVNSNSLALCSDVSRFLPSFWCILLTYS